MNYLLFDCAGPFAGVAVATPQSFYEESFQNLRDQGSRLIPLCQEILNKSGLNITDVDAIITTRGPGSFTGIRVGLATAMGLHLALQKPIFSYSLLHVGAMAAAQKGVAFPFTVSMRTAQNDHFMQTYVSLAECSEAWQGLVSPHPIVAIESLGLTLKSLLETHNQGLEAWRNQAQTNPFEPLYIRAPDVTIRKAIPTTA